MTKDVEMPGTLRLGDMLDMARLVGDIEIINECNETLLIASYVDENVCPLTKVLAKDLLAREVINYGTRDDRTLFKIKGVEDAE